MDIVDAVLHLIDSLGNWFGIFITRITNFFNSVVDIISYGLSIAKAIWFGLVSLLSGIWDLIVEVFQGGVFVNVSSSFVELGDYIGGPAVVFISTLLFLIMFRIGVAFVFKILKLNTDYQMRKTEWKEGAAKSRKAESDKTFIKDW